jgi:hypothetical protein
MISSSKHQVIFRVSILKDILALHRALLWGLYCSTFLSRLLIDILHNSKILSLGYYVISVTLFKLM